MFIGLFLVYVPWVWAIRGQAASYGGLGWLRLLALAPFIGGSYVALRCVFDFAWIGRGTPLPFDPPRRLVVSGPYRYVRNPMFLGFGLAILGETTLLGSLVGGLQYFLVFSGVVTLLILLYEEPTLRSEFGAEYEEYCRNVPRFLPRLTPWWPTGGSAQ